MIRTILWDIDNTLLDFFAAEEHAIRGCFASFGLGECTDAMLAEYSEINTKYWKRLERGELTKQEVLVGRFEEFFAKCGIRTDVAAALNEEYQIRLGDTCVFMDEGDRLLAELKEAGYRQCAVTNGTRTAQRRKLKISGLEHVFDEVFISDEIGSEKPTAGFFDAVFDTLGQPDRDECVIIGDSLTSDMRGGNGAGIRCVWYNPRGLENNTEVRVDCEIRDLHEVPAILNLLSQ